jgi:hypothetical protein
MKYRPYNETFNCYHDYPLELKDANAFIKEQNSCKGGHWVLHTEELYKAGGLREIALKFKADIG